MTDDGNDADPSYDPEDGQEITEEKAVLASSNFAHSLKSLRKGASEVEQMAERIESKRANRVPVTYKVRKKLREECTKIAEEKGYEDKNKIDREDVMELRERVKQQVESDVKGVALLKKVSKMLGFFDTNENMIQVLDKAVEVVDASNLDDDDWLYHRDFGFYYTRVVSKWPWMRSPIRVACMVMLAYFVFTPIFFCLIVDDKDVCERDENGDYGWMSTLYFASATMSTVGYGDVSVMKDKDWRVFMGILFMIISILVAIQAFSAAADAAFSPLDRLRDWLLDLLPCYSRANEQKHLSLNNRIAQLKYVKITEITLQFTLLNLIGMFVSRGFVNASTDPSEKWTWMESFYWAVQTTTTIGYGDLNIPFDMRWFNIFYLLLSTYFVGSALGKLASLKQELEDTRRYYAWERREVSKGMIEEFQAYEHDAVIDQYEFVLASLLTLKKISSDDIAPVMDKFRELSDENGVIQVAKELASAPSKDIGEDPGLSKAPEM